MLHLIFVYCNHEYIISPNSFHFGTASALLCLEDTVHYFPHTFLWSFNKHLFLIHLLASEFPKGTCLITTTQYIQYSSNI